MMDENERPAQCQALTRSGQRCKKNAQPGTAYCYIHQVAGERPPAAQTEPLAAEIPVEEELSERELRRRLVEELDALIARVQKLMPDYQPPAYSPQKIAQALEEGEDRLPPGLRLGIMKRLRGAIKEDLLDAETWKGMWYMVNYTLEYQSDIVKRRLTGDYETDEWGLDWEFLEIVRPFLDFLYKFYWRVETTGMEHIPDYERAILVSNHSGRVPWDGAMIMTAVLNEHPAQRLVRNLYSSWIPALPFWSAVLVKVGQTLASVENGTRLLEQDELVGVFPEGHKGAAKRFKDRYRLARFSQGGFVSMALKTRSPMIPVAVVGAEEAYAGLAQTDILARLTSSPFPVSARYPWLELLGAIPLPARWYIDVGEPIPTEGYGPDDSDDPVLVSQLADQLRNVVQEMVFERLAQRRSVFR
jgi:1-acyl-sn-glycerol-3-phosphate acyltransferase